MGISVSSLDKRLIRRTHELAEVSWETGEGPFGALVTCGDEIVTESLNCSCAGVIGHAETSAIKKAVQRLHKTDLSDCTLYSNFEPCAMCSFLIRDFNVGRVVYSVPSPHWGGVSRWNILLADMNPHITSADASRVPGVVAGVLEREGSKLFDSIGWSLHKEQSFDTSGPLRQILKHA